MIHVEPAPEPLDFDRRVRKVGRAWLPSYWRRAARALRDTFQGRFGYTAMWLSAPGTVDHFVSRNEDRALAYE